MICEAKARSDEHLMQRRVSGPVRESLLSVPPPEKGLLFGGELLAVVAGDATETGEVGEVGEAAEEAELRRLKGNLRLGRR
jgi:hypothetical protein